MKKGEKLEKMIKEKYFGWSLSKFAEYVDIKKTTLHDITKKDSLDKVSIENIKAIAKGLGMSIEELLYRLDNDVPVKNKITYSWSDERESDERISKLQLFSEQTERQSMSEVNYYGPISAGTPNALETITQTNKYSFPKNMLGKYSNREDIYILKVNGESMDRIIPNGSYVVCLPIKEHYELTNGDIVIYEYNNEASMKRFRKVDNTLVFSPESNNLDFHDTIISENALENVYIKAKVILYVVNLAKE